MSRTFTSRIKKLHLAGMFVSMFVSAYFFIYEKIRQKFGLTLKFSPDVFWRHKNREEHIEHFSTFHLVDRLRKKLGILT